MKKILTVAFCIITAISILQAQSKIAVFDPDGDVKTNIKTIIREEISSLFVNNNNEYTVLERANFDQLLKENKFQGYHSSDSEISEIGKRLGADYVCVITVVYYGGNYIVSCKQVDVVSAIIKTQGEGKAKSITQIPKAAREAALKCVSNPAAARRRINMRSNFKYFGFAADTQTPFGISFGSLHHKKFSFYMTAKINTTLFKSTEEYSDEAVKKKIKEYCEKNNLNENVGNELFSKSFSNIYSDDLPAEKHAAANLTLGVTKSIFYPLWVYAGAGVAYRKPLYEVKTYEYKQGVGITEDILSLGDFTKKDEKESAILPSIEAGAIVKLGGFYLNGGFRTDFSGFYLSGGLGITF